jgi:hypothetical protein
MKIRNLLPLIGAAPLALMLLGCPFSPDKEPPKPTPDAYLPQTKPENVLENLQTSYVQREITRFDSLLFDSQAPGADSTEGYTFRFWDWDVQHEVVPDATWGRTEEILSASSMFASPDVEDIDINLTYTPPYYDNTQGHEGQQIIYVTNASLSVVAREPDKPDPTTYLVVSNLARFRFKVQYVSAKGDSLWRIIYWEDLGSTSAAKPGGPSLTTMARNRTEKIAAAARGQIAKGAPRPALARDAFFTRKPEESR